MMGDMADVFNDMRAHKKDKRASNTVSSTQMLVDKGVSFKSLNGGAHLQLNHVCGVINFWPSTGLWMVSGNPKKYRGVRNLLQYFGHES